MKVRELVAWGVALGAIAAMLVVLASHSLPSAQTVLPNPAVTITATPTDQSMFDRGMKAGVKYETWFCANPTLEGASK